MSWERAEALFMEKQRLEKEVLALKARIESAKEEQREACAKNIEQTSLLQGRPMTAAWCRATPIVKEKNGP